VDVVALQHPDARDEVDDDRQLQEDVDQLEESGNLAFEGVDLCSDPRHLPEQVIVCLHYPHHPAEVHELQEDQVLE